MSVRPIRPLHRARRDQPEPGRWTARVFLEDLHDHQYDIARARFDTETPARWWALAQLERLRATHADQLGGPNCHCYVATVHGPNRIPIRAYLFSDWEPIEWTSFGEPC